MLKFLLYVRHSNADLHFRAVMQPDELYFHTSRWRLFVEPSQNYGKEYHKILPQLRLDIVALPELSAITGLLQGW